MLTGIVWVLLFGLSCGSMAYLLGYVRGYAKGIVDGKRGKGSVPKMSNPPPPPRPKILTIDEWPDQGGSVPRIINSPVPPVKSSTIPPPKGI